MGKPKQPFMPRVLTHFKKQTVKVIQEVEVTGFSDVLVQCRKANGWTQDDASERLGCIRSVLANWETARSFPKIGAIPVICKTYGITPNQLFGWEPLKPTRAHKGAEHGE